MDLPGLSSWSRASCIGREVLRQRSLNIDEAATSSPPGYEAFSFHISD